MGAVVVLATVSLVWPVCSVGFLLCETVGFLATVGACLKLANPVVGVVMSLGGAGGAVSMGAGVSCSGVSRVGTGEVTGSCPCWGTGVSCCGVMMVGSGVASGTVVGVCRLGSCCKGAVVSGVSPVSGVGG